MSSHRTIRAILVATALAFLGLPFAPGRALASDPFFALPAVVGEVDASITNDRPWGVATGDFDDGGAVDLVVGRFDGNVYFVHGNGDGTFAAPARITAWKQAFFNTWAFAPGDVNGDGKLDVVWGATADHPTTGQVVFDGEVRVWYGNGDGTFAGPTYLSSGVTYDAGVLIGDLGVDVNAVTTGDVDGDGDVDVVAGGFSGANAVVVLYRNNGGGAFAAGTTLVSSTAGASGTGNPIYWPPSSAAGPNTSSPWGLTLGDAEADGDLDLWVGDRALYVYLYRNNGSGAFTIQGSNSAVPGRPNVYLGHDSFRPSTGYTPSLATGDFNGDSKADLVLGLLSGTQTNVTTPAPAHDGEVILDVSKGTGHTLFGMLGDVGTIARGVSVLDANGDGAKDILATEYTGKIVLFRQLAPVDGDGDGVSDYVDNALATANAPRIDMNTDGALTYLDQLDNDFDTVLGNPEDATTWQRRGDPADADDDNDGVVDTADICAFTPDPGQADVDGDGAGDACDPLDNRDPDGDGVPNGFLPGHPLYEAAKAAAAKWSTGETHFVIRIDALSRFFQNEFTQLMTDAAVLSPADWAAKCWQNYDPEDFDPDYEPCGTGEGTAGQTLTLDGGKEVPISLITIPKQLWTDPPVVAWVNDRNGSVRFELGQHGTYHEESNTGAGSWAGDPTRNFYSCETCGLTEAENYELLQAGYDTLVGDYTNPWVAQSGATAGSPKIDWSSSAHSLLSYAPPFNASDTASRQAVARLGLRSFSASIYEENSRIFSPEGSHQDAFDQFGLFHASADTQLMPPDTTGDTYDTAAYAAYLQSETEDGGLTTWLIEEVDWSGRPCNNADRLGTCSGGTNRENNTVYQPRWNAWLQLLDFVKGYPGGVAMTQGEVALAKAFDNAPSVANPGQADSDHDGIGDVIDGGLVGNNVSLTRHVSGTLSAVLSNAAGEPMSGRTVHFAYDADGDGTNESYEGTTDVGGVASVGVTATRPVGLSYFDVSWSGELGATASTFGVAAVGDTTALVLDAGNPTTGQATDAATVGATLTDSDGAVMPGVDVAFSIGSASATGTTGLDGHASAAVVLGASGVANLVASFAGNEVYGATTSAPQEFTVTAEDTTLVLDAANPSAGNATDGVTLSATLSEPDGPVAGRTVTFSIGSASAPGTTDAAGLATATVVPTGPAGTQTVAAAFAGDTVFAAAGAGSSFDVLQEPTAVTLDATNPVSAQALSSVTVGATLRDDEGNAVAGKTLTFTIGSASQGATTDAAGHASTALFLVDDPGTYSLGVSFTADDDFGGSSTSAAFSIVSAVAVLTLDSGNPAGSAIGTSPTVGATLTDGAGTGLAGRSVTFTIGTATATATTDGSGHATAPITLVGPAGATLLYASWAGDTTYASAGTSAPFTVLSGSTMVALDSGNPTSGQVTDAVTVGAVLTDNLGAPLAGQVLGFTIDGVSGTGTTDAAGHASATLTLVGPAHAWSLTAAFAGAADFSASSASSPFTVLREHTELVLSSVVAPSGSAAVRPTLRDADGSHAGLSGQTVRLYLASTNRRGVVSWKLLGSGTTDATGTATIVVASRSVPSTPTQMKASFGGDKSFLSSESAPALLGRS